MADTKVSGLTTATPADADYFPAVAVSDTTMSAGGSTRRFLMSAVWGWVLGKLTSIAGNIIPDANGTRDLGASGTRFATVHTNAINLGGVSMTGSTSIVDPNADAIMTWDDSQAPGSELGFGTYGQGLTQGGRNPQVTDNVMLDTIAFTIDNGASVITTGVWGDLPVDFACTIQSVTVVADAVGSIVVDIWKDTYGNFPPVVADSICASAKPTLSSANKSQDGTLTGWVTSIAAGDILRFNVDSAATVKMVTVSLKVKRT